MTFPIGAWRHYIDMLSSVNKTAAGLFTDYLNTHSIITAEDREDAIDYAYAIATKLSESSSALSCEVYDAIREASGMILPAAEPAEPATYGEVAKTVNGMIKQNQSNEAMGNAVGRLVKRTGVDTTMKNAIRDGAEWAWIPQGDTCPFCIMLASNGWQRASKKALKGGHAEHIHANCDCTYAVRFNGKPEYEGYDPRAYEDMYYEADGAGWSSKINAMRREQYKVNGDKIRAQKRAAYARRKEPARLSLHTYDDPMREKMGSAYDSHPVEMKRIEKMLKGKGIQVIKRSGSMSYSPNAAGGKPGRLIMDPDASYSAWLHELKHISDDEDSGWMGLRILEDVQRFVQLEEAAYNVEIDFAKQNGYNKIARRLERLKFDRRQELLGVQRNNKQT